MQAFLYAKRLAHIINLRPVPLSFNIITSRKSIQEISMPISIYPYEGTWAVDHSIRYARRIRSRNDYKIESHFRAKKNSFFSFFFLSTEIPTFGGVMASLKRDRGWFQRTYFSRGVVLNWSTAPPSETMDWPCRHQLSLGRLERGAPRPFIRNGRCRRWEKKGERKKTPCEMGNKNENKNKR